MNTKNKKMGTFITKEKIFSKKWFRAYGYIIIGTFIMSVGYVYFINPYKIVPGGIYGISIIIHHTTALPIGITALMFNIPLAALGAKILGPRFGIKTVVGFIFSAVFIDTLSFLSGDKPLVDNDPLLSCVFGGVLIGLGVGLFFKSKATVGGSDVIAMMIGKGTNIPLGQLMMIIDSIIVMTGLVAFRDWKIPLYSWIVIFIMGKVIDVVLEGLSYNKALFIISDKCDLIREKIINDVKRGGTLVSGIGIYKNENRNIIFSVVSRRELEILKGHIKAIDCNAFVTVVNASKIFGRGFTDLRETDED